MKRARRESVDAKIDLLIHRNYADVRLGHVGVDLHLRQIICDGKNYRRLQAGCHGLADIDTTGNDFAIDWRCDGTMIEIRFRLVERALFDFKICFGLMQISHRLIEILLRGILFRDQRLCPNSIDFRQLKCRLRARQITLGLGDCRLK